MPGIVQARDGPVRRADRPALPSVRLRRPGGRRARPRADGLRRGNGARRRPQRCGRSGEKVGVLQVRLFRPFAADALCWRRCRQTVRAIAVLEQTKEPGAPASRCISTWSTTLAAGGRDRQARDHAAGDRRPLRAVVEGFHAGAGEGGVRRTWRKPEPRNSFTVGINDDVSHTSLALDPAFRIEPPDVVQAVFYGLGADGTVGANKNSVKIIAEDAGLLRAGLFRLRLAQVRRADRFASALRPAADPRALSDPAGQLRRLPPVPASSSGMTCCGWRRRAPRSC